MAANVFTLYSNIYDLEHDNFQKRLKHIILSICSFMANVCEQTDLAVGMYRMKAKTAEKLYEEACSKAEEKLKAAQNSLNTAFCGYENDIKKFSEDLLLSLDKFFRNKEDVITDFKVFQCPVHTDGETWANLEEKIMRSVDQRIKDSVKEWEEKDGRENLDKFSCSIESIAKEVYDKFRTEMQEIERLLLTPESKLESSEDFTFAVPSLSMTIKRRERFKSLQEQAEAISLPDRIGRAVSQIYWSPIDMLQRKKIPIFKNVIMKLESAKIKQTQSAEQEKVKSYLGNPTRHLKDRTSSAINAFLRGQDHSSFNATFVVQTYTEIYEKVMATIKKKAEDLTKAYSVQIKMIRQDQRNRHELRDKYCKLEFESSFLKKLCGVKRQTIESQTV